MGGSLDLFGRESGKRERYKPLADRMRPLGWEGFEGLDALDRNLISQLRAGAGKPPSLILWGPPGSGKTTLAKLIGRSYDCDFVEFSAVLGGVKEVREIVAAARRSPKPTILFVDEIHRFNKAQQDGFLPHVEDGTIVLIGATTENPSFYLTSALLSRVKVLAMPALSKPSLEKILAAAANESGIDPAPDAARAIAEASGGDARRLMNTMESLAQALGAKKGDRRAVALVDFQRFLRDSGAKFYDRSGEEHYNMVSAFIKSMRGTDPDAALYWGFRMIESGEDPRFVIRRMMIFASEDIGNADPRALQVAVATSEAFEKLGLPEGKIPIAQCITYLSSAPKSNRSYSAMHAAIDAINRHPKVDVPLHLRNAPTKLMKEMGYGKEYEYPHDSEQGYVAGVKYLPKQIENERFYEPSERGYEKTIKERLELLRATKLEKS